MANGNGGGFGLGPVKTITLSLTLSIGVVSAGLLLVSSRLDEHWDEMQRSKAQLAAAHQEHRDEIKQLRLELADRTDERYRAGDAEKDFALRDFRFKRNEARISALEARIKELKEQQR